MEDRKLNALDCHESRFYGWLAGVGLERLTANNGVNVADRFRERLFFFRNGICRLPRHDR